MAHTIYFISHPEVVISPDVPVPRWPLSDIGRLRMKKLLRHEWIQDLSAIYCSDEQKAIDGAGILANYTGLPYHLVRELGENDRSSTGFLEPVNFEAAADQFFACPDNSFRGWETAVAAQNRIVDAVTKIDREDESAGAIAIVSHGGVGTLLYCYHAGKPIDRRWDQPGNGGGNYLTLAIGEESSCSWWKPID